MSLNSHNGAIREYSVVCADVLIRGARLGVLINVMQWNIP